MLPFIPAYLLGKDWIFTNIIIQLCHFPFRNLDLTFPSL